MKAMKIGERIELLADKLSHFLDASLNTRVAPVSYIIVAQQFVVGLAFLLNGLTPGVKSTALFLIYPDGGPELWGSSVLITAAIMGWGFFYRHPTVVKVGAGAAWMIWIFTIGSYLFAGDSLYLFQSIVPVMNALAVGYFYLAASRLRLWDYSPAFHMD